ncbi:MAG: acetate--CoA ligase family protein [Candidatus Hadarchaeales archaeon]
MHNDEVIEIDLSAFLAPSSVAVIGASRDPNKVGHKILKNMIEAGFGGKLYAINPKATDVLGVKTYGNILDVPGKVDLAIISVPAPLVPDVARDCGRKGVKGIVVVSAGFSEIGPQGLKLEKELVETCRNYGVRLLGPNCLGLINTTTRVNASFSSGFPKAGNITLISQSGALGSAILNWALQMKIGIASFISVGNEADLTFADFIEAVSEDKQTKVIGLYIEGVKEGRRFVEVCRKVSRLKPIVVLKSGVTEAGVRAALSHTGSLAGSDAVFSAVCKKTGIIRAETLQQFFDIVVGFGTQPLPKGKRVLVLTNGGGPGVLAADACERLGLELPLLEEDIKEKLEKSLPPHAIIHNPIDVLGDADENRYRRVLELCLSSARVDAVLVIVTPQAMTPVEKIAKEIANVRKIFPDKPIIPIFMGVGKETVQILEDSGLANFAFPESAILVLAKMYEYSSRSPPPEPTPLGLSLEVVREIVKKAREEGRANLTADESFKLAEACGIPTPAMRLVRSPEEAVMAAEEIGYPVVMKIVSPEVVHKTDIGGVVLNVRSAEEVRKYYEEIIGRARTAIPGGKILGVQICKMLPPAKEVIVGSIRDFQFGPVVMFGLGGIYVDFLRDVSYRLCPLTEEEARELIKETKAFTLLKGIRGEKPSDIDSIVKIILRISELVTSVEEIEEIEANPLFVYEEGRGCIAADIRVTVGKIRRE